MENDYLRRVLDDEALCEAVQPILPGVSRLTAEQVERLVFLLKSIPGGNGSRSVNVQASDAFEARLDVLRSSDSQSQLLSSAVGRLIFGVCCSVVAGCFLTLSLLAALTWSDAFLWVAGTLIPLGIAWFFGFAPSIECFKRQDRQYFLESIRSARTCRELNSAGLFSFNGVSKPGPQSDEALRLTRIRVTELAQQLRDALYRDEELIFSDALRCSESPVHGGG